MASDYDAIRAENKGEYGTGVARYGKTLLVDRYESTTQFIPELLQNAEDALHRRMDPPSSRAVTFDLFDDDLRVAHYGKPFDTADVKGVCGIALGTKQEDVTQIGRFGIGFKSVYSFTDCPKIYSGDESFRIEGFVSPFPEPPIDRPADQTLFVMPLRDPAKHRADILAGLQQISLDTLLFLREVDTIRWHGLGGSATYRRKSESLCDDTCVRRVTVLGESADHGDMEKKSYLVFSKQVHSSDDVAAGHVEVAFLLQNDSIVPVPVSPLVVFFPTIVETHLGFRIQGPYRTTLGRDNVPRTDDWNQQCVDCTGDVLVNALVWLRDNERLDVNVLKCLPIDEWKFSDTMFSPLYDKIRHAFINRRFLPLSRGGYGSSRQVRATQSPGLRALFTPRMLADIYDAPSSLHWLSDDISVHSTPELWRYLRTVVGLADTETARLIRRLDVSFLELRDNDWMTRLYEFMNEQRGLHSDAKRWPLIRLDCGKHVAAWSDEQLQAYLPSSRKTDFPTVEPGVCSTDKSLQFMKALGLTEPDPVDDVIRYVLPKYDGAPEIEDVEYIGHIHRIMDAFDVASVERRNTLVSELRKHSFLLGEDAKSGALRWAKPGEVYVKTERLGELFEGVSNVLFARTDVGGRRIRTMVEACGAASYLRPRPVQCTLSEAELRQIRRAAGLERCTGGYAYEYELVGLDGVLNCIASLPVDDRRDRAIVLWEALADLARQSTATFFGVYRWRWSQAREEAFFDPAFVRKLNQVDWVPVGGERRVPSQVPFESLGWRPDPLLQVKISFRSPAIKQLADEVDIDVEVLRLLKQHGLTRVEDIRELLADDESRSQTIGGREYDAHEEAMTDYGVAVVPDQSRRGPADYERLRQVFQWWNGEAERTMVIDKYEKTVYPKWLRRSGIADGLHRNSEDHWLALLVLGACRSLGRTRDQQHRNFLKLAHSREWWDVFKKPDQPEAWMEVLQNWQDGALDKLAYPQWMSLFPAIYQLSRYWKVYVRMLRSAGQRPASEHLVTRLFEPLGDETLTGAGTHFEAPPAPLGMGRHWVLRELVRMEVVTGEHLFQHCWVPSEQVLKLLERFGLVRDEGLDNPDKARAIFDFMARVSGTENPHLHLAFDIPLRHVARSEKLRRRFGLEQ